MPASTTPPKSPPESSLKSPEHAPLQLESFLPYRLSILSNRISQTIARDYEQRFALSRTEWRVLAVLARFGKSSAGEVARYTEMDKVAVSRALARLVAAGRVSRDSHGDDRRRAVLDLTEAGWAIHDTVAPLARQREREMVAALNPEEQATLTRILDKLDPA